MIRDLTIEYRKNPIGIDEKPRFSWKLESEKQDVVQTSYQIQVVSGGQLCGTVAGWKATNPFWCHIRVLH